MSLLVFGVGVGVVVAVAVVVVVIVVVVVVVIATVSGDVLIINPDVGSDVFVLSD